MFYNPDQSQPSCQFLTLDALVKKINLMAKHKFVDHVAFVDNTKFMQRVETDLLFGKQKGIKEQLQKERKEISNHSFLIKNNP